MGKMHIQFLYRKIDLLIFYLSNNSFNFPLDFVFSLTIALTRNFQFNGLRALLNQHTFILLFNAQAGNKNLKFHYKHKK